jgi:hypothetical protein
MKKTLTLTLLFLALGAGAWFAIRENKKHAAASNLSPEMDFAVPNTIEIGKIFIADRSGKTATLEKKDGTWVYNGKYKARPDAIQNLLTTIRQVKVQFTPTEAAKQEMVKELAADGVKVEIYNPQNQKIKSYYVGGVTADERGTVMIIDGAENPCVVHMPGFVGQLSVRYMLGDDNWRDRTVFSEKPEDIQRISVEYPQQKSESFVLDKTGTATYTVKPFYSTTPASKQPLRKGVPESYLLQFEKRIAEGFETINPARDSVRSLVPFAIVSVKKNNGEEKKVKFWPLEVETNPQTGKAYVFRYFADYNDGEAFLLTQDQVFGPIFQGYNFFFEATGERQKMRN